MKTSINTQEFKEHLELTKLISKLENLPITLNNLAQIKGLFINKITDHSYELDCSKSQVIIPHNYVLYHDDSGMSTISITFPELDNLHIDCMIGLFSFLIEYCPGGVDALQYLKGFVLDSPKPISPSVAKAVLSRNGYIDVYWTTEDILQKANEMGVELSHFEIQAVIEFVQEGYDANFGLDWSSIENAIEHVKEDNHQL